MSISLHPDTSQARTLAGSPVASTGLGAASSVTRTRSRLFTKYVALFVAVVGVALLIQRHFRGFFLLSRAQGIADPDSARAGGSRGRENQPVHQGNRKPARLDHPIAVVGGHASNSAALTPCGCCDRCRPITELAQLDSTGKERLRVSRLAMDVIDSGLDLSKDPKFTEAVAHKVYYGPVYFRRESEPYMTLALAGTRKDAGVSIAEVNLKLIWDVVSQIKVGEHGHAYVVGAQGRLIAHPDISLVLRNTDMTKLAQVQAAQALAKRRRASRRTCRVRDDIQGPARC